MRLPPHRLTPPRLRALALLAAASFALTACGGDTGGARPTAGSVAVPAALTECAQCHAAIVNEFLRHGMSASLGPVLTFPHGAAVQPVSGRRYAFGAGGQFTLLEPDGGRQRQLVVGRIGAGLFDTSWVGAQLDPQGMPTGRLTFLPVETITGAGASLAPFELAGAGAGLRQPVTPECLQCHTLDAPPRVSAGNGTDPRHTYPSDLLGADALQRLSPLSCTACHGPTTRHADLMTERVHADGDDLGLTRLRDLPPARQRDVCARCHLQGEAHMELAPVSPGGPQPADFLARRPALVPARATDDFRFVGQLERLALSACFRGAPEMTCTSCHQPHSGAARQGVASFDAACARCHPTGACSRDPALAVRDVTGEAARSADGCVDCHVRRSQPFDLPRLRTADHFIRRRIPLPAAVPFREHADPDGPLQVFDDGRLQAALATDAGRRWDAGLRALGALRLGRPAEAAALLHDLPPPGSAEARTPPRGAALPPLETCADFHHLRGLVLEAAGESAAALAAYADALALDERHPEARVNHGGLLLHQGDMNGALQDAALLLSFYPRSEQAWNLRALAAARAGDAGAAAAALAASAERDPDNPATWQQLGRLLLALGRKQDALAALRVAAELSPGREGLAADLAAAGGS